MLQNNLDLSDIEDPDELFEEKDDSGEILKIIRMYLSSFGINRSYYDGSYGIFLTEKNKPFRIISIFHHYRKEIYEIRSEITLDDDSRQEIYHFFGNRIECIKTIKKVILGYDQMYNLMNELKTLKN